MTPTTDAPAPPATAVEGVVAADAVLRTADELGLLDHLARGPMSPADLADSAGHDADAVAVLLDALVALGIVECGQEGVRAHPELPALVTTMRTALGTLPERVRTGQPRLAGDRPGEAGELYGRLAAPLGAFFGEVAEEVADVLAAPGLRVLDVGAGAAPWSRAIARRHATTHVTAVDLEPVLSTTRAAIAGDGLTSQFEATARDLLADPLPGGDHDLVVAANLCHLFDGPTSARIVRRLAAAARPGGTVAIIDALPDHADPQHRRSVALYAAGLLTRTATGGVHPCAAYSQWLHAAGCVQVQRHDCTAFPISLITGRVSA